MCFDNLASIQLLPCNHKYNMNYLRGPVLVYFFRGFCDTCSTQLDVCPMCRSSIESILTVLPSQSKDSLQLNNKSKPLPTQETPCLSNQLQMSLSQPTNLSNSHPDAPTQLFPASSQPTNIANSITSPNSSETCHQTVNFNTPQIKSGQLSLHPCNPKPVTAPNNYSPSSTSMEHWLILKC